MFFPYATITVSIMRVFYYRKNTYLGLKDNLLLCCSQVIFTKLIVPARILNKQAVSSTVCSVFLGLQA